MRSSMFLFVIAFLFAISFARPPQVDERNESDAEEPVYEGNDEAAEEEETSQEEEESRLSDQDASDISGEDEVKNQRPVNMGREKYQQRVLAANNDRGSRANSDIFAEYTPRKIKEEKFDEAAHSNDFSVPQRRQSNKYIDSTDDNDQLENVHLTNGKTNRVQEDRRNNELDKRTIDNHVSLFDESDARYENNRGNKDDGEKIEYNNELADPSEQGRPLRQYYNTMESDHKGMLGDRSYEVANRDRRQAEQSDTLNLSSTSTDKNSLSDITNQEDEAAIKRHIRKLSGEELEELLNSLSEDKKALLNKIMDSDSTYETLNKREITKKAGAIEENGFMDSSLSEISKVQGGSSIDLNTESAASPSSDIDNSKQQESQTETVDVSNQKPSDTTRTETVENKAELMGQPNEVNSNVKSDSISAPFEPNLEVSNAQSTKSENKREANLDHINNLDGSFDDGQGLDNYFNAKEPDESFNDDQSHVCSQDDDLAQLMDEEALLHDSYERQYKREAAETQENMDDSVKSLEESFPNSNSEENGQYFESNMAPHVRVKRKNEDLTLKKRAAADVPDARVAYFPYRAENDDEDNEEGSEFDDDGFYDRTSNYAKVNANRPAENVGPNDYGFRSSQSRFSKTHSNVEKESKTDEFLNDKVDSDTRSLGTDSDTVLSGVEGVDDNLMFSSGARNKRTAVNDQLTEDEQNRPVRSTPLQETKPENNINLPNYEENDAFGPLPRNEAELTRYKRIRRVKSSQLPEVTVAEK